MAAQCRQAMLANGQIKEAIDLCRCAEQDPYPECLMAYADELLALVLRPEAGQVEDAITRAQTRLGAIDASLSADAAKRLRAQLEYCRGHATEASRLMRDVPGEHFAAMLTAGETAAAEQEMRKGKGESTSHLLLYLSAMQAGRKDLAEEQLRKAIELLAQGDYENRAFASALNGKADLPRARLLRLSMSLREKVVIVTALGVRDRDSRAACFDLARKLNFDRRFPYLLLKSIHDAPPAP